MYKKSFSLLSLVSAFNLFAFSDLPSQGVFHKNYFQDQLVNGEIIAKGNAPYQQEIYQLIINILEQYQRPITTFEFDAAQGYYSLRLATEHPGVVAIMAETDEYLNYLCLRNTQLDSKMLLNKKLNTAEIKRLAECEHIDLTLMLNGLQNGWQNELKEVLKVGENTLIAASTQEQRAFCQRNGGKLQLELPAIGSYPQTAIYHFTQNKKYIIRASWFEPVSLRSYKIDSSFAQKKLLRKTNGNNKDSITIDWIPGINLLTFKMLNGTYPTTRGLQQRFLELDGKGMWFKEPLMSNFIITGEDIVPIEASMPFAQIVEDFNIVMHYVIQLLNISPEQVAQLQGNRQFTNPR